MKSSSSFTARDALEDAGNEEVLSSLERVTNDMTMKKLRDMMTRLLTKLIVTRRLYIVLKNHSLLHDDEFFSFC